MFLLLIHLDVCVCVFFLMMFLMDLTMGFITIKLITHHLGPNMFGSLFSFQTASLTSKSKSYLGWSMLDCHDFLRTKLPFLKIFMGLYLYMCM